MKIHPLAELFPPLDRAELQSLADDIKANGQQEPIVLHEGQILDGRNRLAACEMVGVEPRFNVAVALHKVSAPVAGWLHRAVWDCPVFLARRSAASWLIVNHGYDPSLCRNAERTTSFL